MLPQRNASLWLFVSEYTAWCLGWGAIAPMGEVAARRLDDGFFFAASKLAAFPLHMHRLLMPVFTEFVPALEFITETAGSIHDGTGTLSFYLLPIIIQFGWQVLPVAAGAAMCSLVLPLARRLLRTGKSTNAEFGAAGLSRPPAIWPAFAIGMPFSAVLVFLACLHAAVLVAFVIGLGNSHNDLPTAYDPAYMPEADLEDASVSSMTLQEIFSVALLGTVMLGVPFLGGPFLAMFLRRELIAAWRRLPAR